jgi:hypothetical protein
MLILLSSGSGPIVRFCTLLTPPGLMDSGVFVNEPIKPDHSHSNFLCVTAWKEEVTWDLEMTKLD